MIVNKSHLRNWSFHISLQTHKISTSLKTGDTSDRSETGLDCRYLLLLNKQPFLRLMDISNNIQASGCLICWDWAES